MDLTELQVAKLISTQFPDLGGRSISAISEGSDHWSWHVGDDWIFRFPREDEVAERLVVEAKIMPELSRQLPLDVPTTYRLGEPTELFPRPFLGHRMLIGVSGQDFNPSNSESESLGSSLGRFFSALHSVDCAWAARFGVAQVEAPSSTRLLERLRVVAPLLNAVCSELPEGIDPYLDGTAEVPPSVSRSALIHGDVKGEHILVGPGSEVAGVIDWTDICVSNPVWDLVGLAYWLGNSFVAEVLRHYDFDDCGLLFDWTRFVARVTSLERLGRLLEGEHSGPRNLLLLQVKQSFQ